MKRSTQILIAIVAVIAVGSFAIISCNKETKVKDARPVGNDKLAADVSILAVDSSCLINTGTISSTGTTSSYTSWTTTSVTLGTSPNDVTIQFEGTFGSFIRATSANTYIGTINQDSTCAAWSVMAGQVKIRNAAGNLGAYPRPDSCNVVGLAGTVNGHNYGLGYYSYDPTLHTYVVNRAIVIYKNTGANKCSVVSPGLTNAYVLWVSTIIPNAATTAGTVKYRWYKRV